MTDTPPIDPAILAACSDGALSVPQAAVFTGDSRRRLFELMEAGVLEWYSLDANQPRSHRRILRRSVVEYVASRYAAHKRGSR